MPTYVYECKKCLKVFEADQRITESPLTDCDCGAVGSLRRLIQPTAMMFKGSGFYVNDAAKSTAPSEKSEPIEVEGASAPAPAAAPSQEAKPMAEPSSTSPAPPEKAPAAAPSEKKSEK